MGRRTETKNRRLTLSMFVGLVFAATAGMADPLDEARAHYRAGRWPEALAAFRAVASSSSDPSEISVAHHNACLVLIRMSEHEAALGECRTALGLRRELDDQRGLGRTLNNLGLALRYLGRYDEATIAYREALAINERRGDVEAQVLNRSNLGFVAMTAGDYGEAMRHLTAAETQAEAHLGEPWARKQYEIARLNQGVVLEKVGAYREALDLYLELSSERDEGDPAHWASIQVNLGVMYRNLGNPVRAVEAFEEAAGIYEELGDVAALSNTRLNLAIALHVNLKRLDEAEAAYREALELARMSGDRSEELQDLFYLGDLELELGRVEVAEDFFRQCLELGGHGAEGRWPGLYGLGRVAEARAEAGSALDYLRQAMDEIEQVRRGLAETTWRSGYFGDKRPIYAAAVRVLVSLHGRRPGAGHAEEAFAIVQRAKARELVELLGAPREKASPLDAERIRALVQEGEVWLEYFQGEENLFLWVVDGGGVRLASLGPAAPIFDRVARAYRDLATNREPSSGALAELSRALLGPAGSLSGAKTLRIAPDGRLHYLPFEILPDPADPDRLLVDRLAVTYLPSASTAALLGRGPGREAGARRLVGFANPDLPFDPDNPKSPASLLISRYELGPLPAAEREIAAVERIVGGEEEIRIGESATEDAFRRAVARGAEVVHLATHTVLDERPGQGVIVLASGGGHDGLLRPEEISALDYRAELTVLASCRSALGAIEEGRALSSLTGSLLAAGSSTVVATLWDVDDAAASVFMEQFYYQLARGHGAAEALRRAKRRLRADPGWNRPGLWAAWILVGEGDFTLARTGAPGWVWASASALLVGVVLALSYRWIRRRPVSDPVGPERDE